MQRLVAGMGVLAMVAVLTTGCDPVGSNINDNGNGNTNQNTNYNTNQNQITQFDASIEGFVTLTGTVWSPGADQAAVIEANRFPIPGAVVIAYHSPPADVIQGNYCNECVEIPAGTPNVLSNPVDGSFEMLLLPNRTYYLTVQKGEFRRVREITTPNDPDGTFTFDTGGVGDPRAEQTTLPNFTDQADPGHSDNIPKIAMIDAAYENHQDMFEAMGFVWADAVTMYVGWGGGAAVTDLLNNAATLSQYNLVIAPCGEEWPYGGSAAANLRQYVKDGGSLYVDDFNYDFVEQVWPEFLSFHDGSSECGGGSSPPSTVGTCNHWSSYDFSGEPGNEDFRGWLTLINGGSSIFTLELAYDYIYSMAPGEVGVSETGTGPNGEVYQEPYVWMYNMDSSPAGTMAPATVAWPFYCGRVAYTVYHTEANGGDELLLQEKIMMYLIMEVQTCSTGPIVD